MTSASDRTERCKKAPIKGGTVCLTHGGNLPNVKRSAAFRLARTDAERKAMQRLRDKFGTTSTTDAIAEIDKLANEAIVFKDICRDKLIELDQVRYEGKAGEQLRAEVALYERSLDRCNVILSSYVKLGIAERKQKLDEAEALLVVGVIKAVLNRLKLTAEQKVIAGQVVPEELRAISAAAQ